MKALLWKTLAFVAFVGLYAAPQHHTALWALAWVALVPWIVAVLARPRRGVDLLLAGLSWYLWVILGVYWLRAFGTAAWLVTPFFYVIPFYVLAWFLRFVHRRLPQVPLYLSFALLFTAGEWIRILISPGQIFLVMAGYSQVHLPWLIQFVDLTGVIGLTFLLGAVNGLLAQACLALLDGRANLRKPTRGLLLPAAVLSLLVLTLVAYGAWRDGQGLVREGPRVAVVQPNLPHYPPTEEEKNRAVYRQELAYTLARVPPGSADILLWPENALLDRIIEFGEPLESYMQDMKTLTARLEMGILLDASEIPEDSDGWAYHTVFQFNERGEMKDRSRKVFLLPWTEYVPFADILDWFFLGDPYRALVRKVVAFIPEGRHGTLEEATVFELPWKEDVARFGVPICFESGNPSYAREMARRGADFLVNPTSEGSLGYLVYRQTLIINAFRAVENRIPVVRAANTGISGILDADGRVHQLLQGEVTGSPVNEPGVLISPVPLDARTGTTLYTRWGDWFPWSITGLTGLLLLASLARPVHRRPEDSAPTEPTGSDEEERS